ncbi:unnamed protein product [Oikopleura dioica]|uniref:poly(ADP-ribose) glycohydrolase n=1 Tax=Oikopleura dioica TaxID=34765 RepID=E4XB13_OIKDI|nr:unnamed protein product [Oikopleura dioica]
MNDEESEGKQQQITHSFRKRKRSSDSIESKKICVDESMQRIDHQNESDDDQRDFPTFSEKVEKFPKWKELRRKENCQFLFDVDSPDLAPYPKRFADKWDANHVRMPFSKENTKKTSRLLGMGSVLVPKWEDIMDGIGKYQQPIKSPVELLEAIQKYNKQVIDISLVEKFFEAHASIDESTDFFEKILPKMQKMVAKAPEILTQAPRLLKNGLRKEQMIWMTQEQCAHMLVLSFFCCWPKRAGRNAKEEYTRFNEINFTRFLSLNPTRSVIAKLRCIIQYFKSVTESMPKGVISFKRTFDRAIPNLDDPEFDFTEADWTPCKVVGKGLIEDDGAEFIQADFANKFIGGGTLGRGCVQEEIRFMICPELIITQLLCEEMKKEESIIVTGVQRFSRYTGYADSFRFDGAFEDPLVHLRDCYGRIPTEVFAIDAVNYVYPYPGDSPHDQFSARSIKRDILKAYTAFKGCTPATIATGNWGCGAFGGDPELKFVIQMIAAALAKRPLHYFCFDDLMTPTGPKLSETLDGIKSSIIKKSIPLVFELLTDYMPLRNGQEKFSEYLKNQDP